eukprot:TRINITY_DN67175_c0_g1_i1.p1 TRINITY_DN67175_c0_g1~~TRINITY_DN67175_c0_g1_i1.p1  ORF type:complete len:566 (-),score=81.95 TRINITY_DN67175_c0_g1_i1:32-1729(-)
MSGHRSIVRVQAVTTIASLSIVTGIWDPIVFLVGVIIALTPVEAEVSGMRFRVDGCDTHGRTAANCATLFSAVELGHVANLQSFLASRASVHARDATGASILHRAVEAGHSPVVSALLDNGAAVSGSDDLGWTPLHWAALRGSEALAEILIARRADVTAKERVCGCTSLHWAARRGHIQMLRLLAARGANVATRDDEGRTAVEWARLTGHDRAAAFLEGIAEVGKVIESLERESDSTTSAVAGESILAEAATLGDAPAVRRLFSAKERATKGSDTAAINTAIDMKVSGAALSLLQSRDEWAVTPLHQAAASGHVEVVELLLKLAAAKGTVPAALVALDRWGRSPLLTGCGHTAVVAALLEHRARPDETDLDMRTALQWAVLQGKDTAAELLLGAGADAMRVDRWGRGVVHHAAANGHVTLLKSLARGFTKEGGLSVAVATPPKRDNSGQMPLHLAAAGGHTAAVEELLGNQFSCPTSTAVEACVNEKDHIGRTPLHYASARGFGDTARALLAVRASPFVPDSDGRTPWTFAKATGQHELISLFADRSLVGPGTASRHRVADLIGK